MVEGVCMAGGMCGMGACVTGGMHGVAVCMAGGHAWQGGVHGRYYEIRSMSGRYASRLNAFLYLKYKQQKYYEALASLISKLCNVTILIFLNPNICPHYNY